MKIQNLLRDNRSILRKGLVLHTIAYIRDLHVCICQDLFVNTKVVELRLKALIDEKKNIRSLLHIYVVTYIGPSYTLYFKVFS